MRNYIFPLFVLCGFFLRIAPARTQSLSTSKWQLVWSDEFNGTGKPDPSKWLYETGDSGSANHEAQAYTDRIDNAYLENGHLVIKAVKEDFADKHYTSARLNSRQSWTYGRFEFRAKFPRGRGTWPAAWMLPDAQTYGDGYWPDNGEIDVLEAVGFDPNVNHFLTHTKDFNWMNNNQPTFLTSVPDADQAFHTYALEWSPDHLDFFIDQTKYMTVEKKGDWRQWPFDQNFHLILNLAIGGSWGGMQGIDDQIFPATFEIDYVRVYKMVTHLSPLR
jgi:licheninase